MTSMLWSISLLMLMVGIEVSAQNWQNSFDRRHHFKCPAGQTVSRIKSEHSDYRGDRKWEWSCRPDDAIGETCYWGKRIGTWSSAWANGLRGLVNFECPTTRPLIAGTESIHNNVMEDRKFKYYCCQTKPECTLTGCYTTDYLNNNDGRMDYEISSGMELNGLWSQYSIGSEDRRWKARICNVECGVPTYEVVEVKWDTTGIATDMPPESLAVKRIYNPTDATIRVEVDFDEKRTTQSTTSWEQSFGTSVTWSAGVNLEIFSATTEVTLSYDYTTGKTSSVTVEKSFTRKYEAEVPPYTSIEFQLMAKKADNLKVPFTATLRRLINGQATVETKKGVWQGILYTDDTVRVKNI